MNQSNLIFAAIFVAFIVFITMRGELPRYLSALIGTNAAPAPRSGGSSGGAGGVAGAVSGAVGGPAGQIAGQAAGAAASAIGGALGF